MAIRKMKLKPQIRSFTANDMVVDENGKVRFSFSSEYPVERWFGKEILSHAPGAADLTRLKNAASFLWNHDTDIVIGVIEDAAIGSDKRGYCEARFASSEVGTEKRKGVEEKILRNVSFGYRVLEMVLVKTGDGSRSEDEYLVTKWEPYEVSLVSVPADPTVGVGRANEENAEQEVTVIVNENDSPETKEKEPIMETKTPEVKVDAGAERAAGAKAERERSTAIAVMGQKYSQPELARQLIDNGASLDEARGAFLDKVHGGAPKALRGNEAEIGLNEKEIRKFSFVRAIAALANPGDARIQEAAKFEREVSDAAAKVGGKAARGFMVPVDILRAGLIAGRRDLTVGVPADGGNLVATDLLAASFIDLLRKKSVLNRAGATMLNGLVGNIAIPRQTGAATAYWVAEGGAATESKQAFDQVPMSPKTISAFTDYSRRLMLQSSIDVEAMVRGDLSTVLALGIDRAGLYGTGSANQPLGLIGQTGINLVDFAGVNPTWAETVDMETQIASDDADVGAMKYLANAKGRGHWKTTEKASGTAQFIMQGNEVNGYPVEISNQINDGDYFFGNFADLIMGFWSGLDLMVDPYTGSTSGTVRVVAMQDCDVAIRHGASFCRGYQIP